MIGVLLASVVMAVLWSAQVRIRETNDELVRPTATEKGVTMATLGGVGVA